MKISTLLLAGAFALALTACGKKEETKEAPRTQASQQAVKTNADSPLNASFKLKGAQAIDIDEFFALIPKEDGRPTYESASFDNKIGATVVTNLRFADANDGEGVNIARAEFYGVDIDAINRIKANDGGAADAPFETIFQKVRLFELTTEGFGEGSGGDEADLTIGAVEIDNFALRQSGVEGDGQGDEGARFINATTLAGLYFKDISLVTKDDNAPSISLTAPDLRFVGVGGGKLSAIIANDLEYSMSQSEGSLAAMRQAFGPQAGFLLNGPLSGFIAPANQTVKLKSFEWRDIDFSGLLTWSLKDEEPPMTATDLINLGAIKMTDAETFIGEKRATYMKEATVSAMEFTWLAPSKIRADTKGAVYDFTAYVPETEEATLNVLKEHGLNNVKGDGYAEWVWNAKSGAAGLDYLVETQGLADFSMNMDFSGLKLSEIAKAKDNGEANPVGVHGKFNGFGLKVVDEKALDAIFAISALQMGGTGADLRQSAPAMIRLSGAQAAMMNPRISGYVNAIADFIAKGGTLEIKAQPADPVAFSVLQSTGTTAPQTLPDVLELEVTHKK